MSVKWACDYPGCDKSSQEHKDWINFDPMLSRRVIFFLTIPVAGNIAALMGYFSPDFRYYCPEHAELIMRKP